MAIIDNLKGEHDKKDTYKRALRVLFSLMFPIFATLIYWQANSLSFKSINNYMDVKGEQQSHQYARLLFAPMEEQNQEQIELLLTGLTSQTEVLSATLYDRKGVQIAKKSNTIIDTYDVGSEQNYIFVSEILKETETYGYLSVELNARLIRSHFETIQDIQRWQLLIFFVLSFLFGCWITNRWYKAHLKKKYRPKTQKAAL